MGKHTWIIAGLVALIAIYSCSISNPHECVIRIGTYNLKDFFDAVDDPHHADDAFITADRLDAISQVINSANCDILALQEVENLELLEWFNDTCLDEPYPVVILEEGNDPRGIDVALLSRISIDSVTSYSDRVIYDDLNDRNYRFSRDLLTVTASDSEGEQWVFMVTHLKSGIDEEDFRKRDLQVEEIREIIFEDDFMGNFRNGNLVLMCDLNAEPWSEVMDKLRGVPFSDPGRDYPYRETHRNGKVLDYILLSPDADKSYLAGSYSIFLDDPAVMASDHYLVSVDLLF